MGLNAEVLRTSFALIAEREPSVTHRFYENLFADYPQAKPLFHLDRIAAQERMLGEALAAVLDHLEDAPWLTTTLGSLGEKHIGYGVTPEMYQWVGATLLKTFAQVAGADWTRETEAAWSAAYGAIVGLMLGGTKAATETAHAAPPT